MRGARAGVRGGTADYAVVLNRQNKHVQALAQVDQLLAADPPTPTCRNLKAAILGAIGEYERSIEIYAGVLDEYPNHAKVWMSYGHALKTASRTQDGIIAAYRRSLELAPNAWRGLLEPRQP